MNALIVYAHPNPKSFNHAIFETAKEALEQAGHKVHVRDLYAQGFQPVLKGEDFVALQGGKVMPDVKAEQDEIRKADLLVIIHPIWWAGLPAMIKGYIDRVFTHGFAFAVENGQIKQLLKGKKALIITTTGTPKEMNDKSGMTAALDKTQNAGIYEFCGIEVVSHAHLGGVPYVDDAARKQMLKDVRTACAGLR